MSAKLEQAIQKCVDRINCSDDGESVDIYKFMYRFKIIRELPDAEQEKVYDAISKQLGF